MLSALHRGVFLYSSTVIRISPLVVLISQRPPSVDLGTSTEPEVASAWKTLGESREPVTEPLVVFRYRVAASERVRVTSFVRFTVFTPFL